VAGLQHWLTRERDHEALGHLRPSHIHKDGPEQEPWQENEGPTSNVTPKTRAQPWPAQAYVRGEAETGPRGARCERGTRAPVDTEGTPEVSQAERLRSLEAWMASDRADLSDRDVGPPCVSYWRSGRRAEASAQMRGMGGGLGSALGGGTDAH